MKLNLLETHDRLIQLMKRQADVVAQGCEDCLKRNPLSLALQSHSPYIYIFAHPRSTDDGLHKRMLWQPRLGKPKAQTNSYLFRATSNTDILEVCWMIPPREMWSQYQKGNITENETVNWSIAMFQHNRRELEKSYPDDLSDERIKTIYTVVAADMDRDKRMKEMYVKPVSEEAFEALTFAEEPSFDFLSSSP